MDSDEDCDGILFDGEEDLLTQICDILFVNGDYVIKESLTVS